jgi:NAD-dependent SIR2 family protein deacetylase
MKKPMKDQQDISRYSENAAHHEAAKEKADERLARTAGSAIFVTCQDCGTKYEMGNGQLAAAEKRGHYHHLGHCPKCDRKTWSEAFPVRPMTRAEIAAAFHAQNAPVVAPPPQDSDSK